MTSEHDSLDASIGATFASSSGRRERDGITHDPQAMRAPPAGLADPLDKQLVKRALFPQRAVPVRIGRFTVLGLVGRGGMGVVYACYDELLDRKVAVKVLQTDGAHELASARLQREAQALAKLNHPNVVAVHDVGTVGERVYLAMEFVDGQTLADWVAATRPDWRAALRVIVAAGEGLAAAHAKGLIHRDIKPDNIMIDAEGRVRVMDFGLAHADKEAPAAGPMLTAGVARGHDALATEITRTGAVLGTPAYMASEQFVGEPTDARSDQFSLCATAWEALYGQPAYAGDSLLPLSHNVVSGTLTPPPAGSKVPSWVRRVLERGLRARPDERYPDMRALLQALRADPTRRRWIAGVTAGGVAVALAAGLAIEWARTSAAQAAVAACEAEGAVIDADWNADTRATLERSFLATGKPHASTSLARTLPWLDRWAGSWRAAAVAGCTARTIDRTWDADLRVRALDCLDEARGNFVALVRELGATDATSLVRATSAAAGLAPVDPCARPDALRQRAMTRPAQRDEVAAVRARLAQAGSLEAAGRYTEGLAAANAALVAARASGWAPVLAQAELRVASLGERTGDFAGAEAGLKRALAAAAEARAPDLALLGTIDLVYLVGYRGSRPAEGEVWAESAKLQLAMLPGEHPLELADLSNHRAGVAYVTGDYDKAAQLYGEALALREGALGADHPRVGDSLGNLAGARFAQGAYDEATRLYGRALVLLDQTLGPEHPQVATTLSNLALVHQSTGAYAEAIRVLTRALAIREAALGADHPQIASTLSNLALVHEATGAYPEAAALFVRALVLLERAYGPEHPQVADCVHNLATVRYFTGEHDEAVRLFTRALAIYEHLVEKDHPMMATSLAGLAQVHHARGQFADALRLYTRALQIVELAQGPGHPNVAHVLHGLGETHRSMGHAGEALALLERALAIRSAASVQDQEVAESRFSVARALPPAQAQRARELAEQALASYAAAAGSQQKAEVVRAWLAERTVADGRVTTRR